MDETPGSKQRWRRRMRAMVYTEYGSPDVLQLREVERPTPKDGEVLVRVHAASVNYGDWAFLRGKPFVVRLMSGAPLKPKNTILGADVAGRVETVGGSVRQFQPGDDVFGDISACGFGAFAEYVPAPEHTLALKPTNVSFEEAAAVPMAGVVALQGLRDVGNVQPGQKVLIVGASGGNGTFAVQIAKSFGAEVTGVCSTRNLDMVRSLGADHVIDYTQDDFANGERRYDLILGAGGYRSIFDYRRALNPEGTYVMVGGAMAQVYEAMILGSLLSMTGSKRLTNLAAESDQEDLAFVGKLIEAGKVVPVIDRRYPLSDVPEALRYYGEGHSRGKVVVTVVQGEE
jgi:NADPH:quinone reductase-like Zn-dependent oxidoreductase